ncbi:ferritin-like domain-containing protein [Thermoleophilum album]|uniref:Ferritin-like domain-containing protein n=1 Tax=Thermoleophilum album TaxID=29539 RepID=A0A1H6FHV4_THEAL|nr:ferritin-like domain-containing protein [Thermoleophilum album]SEH10417.1 Ferritin-like domain-containing protein [Thermoleophilum album]
MSEAISLAYRVIDEQEQDKTASTRRGILKGAAATFGSLGLLGLVADDRAVAAITAQNDPQKILNIAATAEVLATIINTEGARRVRGLDRVTRRNVAAAAQQELEHYKVLRKIGGKELTKKIWVPDAVFASRKGLLTTLEFGDQVFINAYLIATTVFGNAGQGENARYAAEFMGVEAVHRALARQSLGKLGNDRVFMRYAFTQIDTAVKLLQDAGVGFGQKGKSPGRFYDFDVVKRRTPKVRGNNTFNVR